MPNKRSKSNTEKHNSHLKKRKSGGKSGSSTNPDRRLPGNDKKYTHLRSKSKIKLLNMYREKVDMAKMTEEKYHTQKIEPDRKWFGNIRTVDQKDLDRFRADQGVHKQGSFNFLLKKRKVDLEIFTKAATYKKSKLTDVESFQDTFGPKQRRHKPKITVSSLEQLANKAKKQAEEYKLT